MKFESVLSVATFTHMSSITFVPSVLSVRLAELSFWPLHTSPATLYVKSAQKTRINAIFVVLSPNIKYVVGARGQFLKTCAIPHCLEVIFSVLLFIALCVSFKSIK